LDFQGDNWLQVCACFERTFLIDIEQIDVLLPQAKRVLFSWISGGIISFESGLVLSGPFLSYNSYVAIGDLAYEVQCMSCGRKF
jgi:hypothetical protein